MDQVAGTDPTLDLTVIDRNGQPICDLEIQPEEHEDVRSLPIIMISRPPRSVRRLLPSVLTPGKLAKNENLIWRHHNAAQILAKNGLKGSDDYNEHYEQFALRRATIDEHLFEIPFELAWSMARWQVNAAKYHDDAEQKQGSDSESEGQAEREDDAEHEQDSGSESEGQAEWEVVGLMMTARFMLINVIKPMLKTDSYHANELITWANSTANPLLVIQSLAQINPEALTLSKIQAKLELMQWQAHHLRDYHQFAELTVKLYESLGVKSIVRAVGALVTAAKAHDNAELPEQKRPNIYWRHAKKYLDRFYTILSTK